MTARIRPAVFPGDAPALEVLFGKFLDELFARLPEHRAAMAGKYDPERVPEMVADFARLHAGPGGALLIAESDGAPAGCAMMRARGPGIVEIQRMFVTRNARGTGLGKALLEALIARARRDGQRLVRLDTGPGMTEAIGLYTGLGFRQRGAYHADHPELVDLLIYFELAL